MPTRQTELIEVARKLAFEFFDFFREHRHGFKEVANYAVVGNVEDGSFGIFVDGYDGLRVSSCRRGVESHRKFRSRHKAWRDRLA
jgi:hypothetical protein